MYVEGAHVKSWRLLGSEESFGSPGAEVAGGFDMEPGTNSVPL